MIRFVDLTVSYWCPDVENSPSPPCCSFIDTVTDRFVEVDGSHVFDHPNDLVGHELAERLTRLVPPGFWQR